MPASLAPLAPLADRAPRTPRRSSRALGLFGTGWRLLPVAGFGAAAGYDAASDVPGRRLNDAVSP